MVVKITNTQRNMIWFSNARISISANFILSLSGYQIIMEKYRKLNNAET